MKTILWKPTKKIKENSNLNKYEIYLQNNYNLKIQNNFYKIHKWSIQNPRLFWNSVWEYAKIKGIKKKKL